MGRTTSYGYDALSRQISISNLAIQGSPLLQKSYTLDGVLASITDANNHATSFAYDGFDRLATTTYPPDSTNTQTTEVLAYDGDSNVTSRKTRAGDTIGFSYDTLNRLITKSPPSPATAVNYGYDLNNHLTSVSDGSAAIPAAVPPSGPSVQFATSAAYDTVNRPTAISWTPAAAAAAATGSGVTFTHTYNKANQRIGQTVTDNSWLNYPAATPTVNYTANALNQYTAVGAVTPAYDGNTNGNGNLTFDGTFTFGYDAENRLTSAVGAGNTSSYSYDAQGRRKTRTVNSTTTVFVTDAGNREVLEYDGSSGAIQRWYAYGLGSNDVLNQTNVVAGTRTAFIPDIQGSVIASLDSTTATLTKISYLPYGKSASATAPFGYTGQRIDPETNGLYYYRARHYSPAWGRFMQPDPIGYRGGVNLYAYVGNDPLNLVDPFGHVWQQSGSAAGATAAGIQLSSSDQNAPDSNVQLAQFNPARPVIPLPPVFVPGTPQNDAFVDWTINAGRAIGNAIGSIFGTGVIILNADPPQKPPNDLVGVQDSQSGMQGNRQISGPLAPEHGGTGNAQKDFDLLTGGQSSPAPPDSTYPPGTLIGTNGIVLRPGTESAGQRIDIPSNGTKPHETLHY